MTIEYRADIDGLRAVAVLSVFMYHLGLTPFSGGYVGVDIFFVISGFLITRIITRDIEQGQFTLTAFYIRRIKRILPALALMAATSLVVAYILLAPEDLAELGDSVAAMSMFVSNIYFYMQSGYFDAPAEMKPLLHTWSLAVEEQYYLLFPLMMVAIAKWGRSQYAGYISVLCGLSFAVGLSQSYGASQSAAFYWLSSRAWELFVGGLLAMPLLPISAKKMRREILSLLGLILIALSVFGFDDQTVFPGLAALAPTLGAALIIYAGLAGGTMVGRMLSIKPLLVLGLISYSLYLWHWPIIVYAKYYSITPLGYKQMAAVLVVAVLISWLSWRYVETPFRKTTQSTSKVIVVAVTLIVILFVAGLTLSVNNGFESRYQNVVAHKQDKSWLRWTACQNVQLPVKKGQELCTVGKKGAGVQFLIWGDSHAKSLADAFDMAAKEKNIAGNIAVQTGCPPLLGVERKGRVRCHHFNQAVLQYIKDRPAIKTVVLSARWALSAEGSRYKQETGKLVELVYVGDERKNKDEQNGFNGQTNISLLSAGLRQTVEQLTKLGRRVLIVGPVPEIGYHVPAAEFVASRTKQNVNQLIAPTKREFEIRTKKVATMLTQFSTKDNVSVIAPAKLLCKNDRCNVYDAGKVLYRDDDHLSTDGARYIKPLFSEYFHKMESAR